MICTNLGSKVIFECHRTSKIISNISGLLLQIEIKLKTSFVTIIPNNYGKNTAITRALDFMQSEVRCRTYHFTIH